jgi:hypothetical protein
LAEAAISLQHQNDFGTLQRMAAANDLDRKLQSHAHEKRLRDGLAPDTDQVERWNQERRGPVQDLRFEQNALREILPQCLNLRCFGIEYDNSTKLKVSWLVVVDHVDVVLDRCEGSVYRFTGCCLRGGGKPASPLVGHDVLLHASLSCYQRSRWHEVPAGMPRPDQ